MTTSASDFTLPAFIARVKQYLSIVNEGTKPEDYAHIDTHLTDIFNYDPNISEQDLALLVFGCPDTGEAPYSLIQKYPLLYLTIEREA